MRGLVRIASAVPEHHSRFIAIIIVSVVAGAAAAGSAFAVRELIDAVGKLSGVPDHLANVARAGCLFVFLRVLLVSSELYLRGSSHRLWTLLTDALRRKAYSKVLHRPIEFYETTPIGMTLEKVASIPTIGTWYFELTRNALTMVLQLLCGVVILLFKAAPVGGILSIVICVNVFVLWKQFSNQQPLRYRTRTLSEHVNGLLAETLSQISIIRCFGGETAVLERFEEKQRSWREARATELAVESRYAFCLQVMNASVVILAASFATMEVLGGKYSAGDIYLVFSLTLMVVSMLGPITYFLHSAGETDALACGLLSLLDTPAHEPKAGMKVLRSVDSLEFRNVSFRYPEQNRFALKDISFKIKKGECVALVGENGSGKSTVGKLIVRLYDPLTGDILINGRDIKEYDIRSLRSVISLFLQDVALFNDTIENNIRFSKPNASAAEMETAWRMAGIDNTANVELGALAGERGVKFSGGERQRIALARVLLGDATLIVLDEVTSALDLLSERLLIERLLVSLRGKTLMFVAHRPAIMTMADRIIVLKGGRVAAVGDHVNLLKTCPSYALLHS